MPDFEFCTMHLEQAGIHLRRGNDTAARSAIARDAAILGGQLLQTCQTCQTC